VLDAVIRDAESMPPTNKIVPVVDPTGSLHGPALAEAAVTLATTAHADAIVAITSAGKTARLLSALRPSAPIFAAAPDATVAGALALPWGVVPFITAERDVERLKGELLDRRLLAPGSSVVFINVSPEQDRPDANFVHVYRLGSTS
jgi:pyruvate kinase